MKRFTKLSSMLLLLLMTAWTQMFASGGLQAPFIKKQALLPADITAGKSIAIWVLNGNLTNNIKNGWLKGTASRSTTLTNEAIFIVEDAGDGYICLKRKSDGLYMQKSGNNIAFTDNKENAVILKASKPGTDQAAGEDGFDFQDDPTIDTGLSDAPAWDPNYDYLVRFCVKDQAPMFLNGNSGFVSGTGNWSAFLVMNPDAIPFENTTIENGQFKNATWYRIQTHATESKRHYWKYDADNSSVTLTNTTDENNFSVFSEDQLFCFVYTNSQDIKIYNKAAGTSKWVTYDESKVSVETGDAITGTWTLTPSTDAAYFCFKTNKPDVTNCYINNIEGTQLGYWTGNDEGSTCYFTEYNVEDGIATSITTLENKLASIESISGFVGAPSKESIQNAIDEFKQNPTQDNYTKAIAAFENVLQVESDKYYRIINADYATQSTPRYISIAPNKDGKLETVEVAQKEGFSAMPQTLIRFNEVENGEEAKIYTLNIQGEYMGNTQDVSKPIFLENRVNENSTYQAGQYRLDKKADARYVLYCTNATAKGDGNKVCPSVIDNGTTLTTWGDGVPYSQWFIQPVTDVQLEISSAGYATVNYPFAITLPEGLTAYTGEANAEQSKFLLEEIPNGEVPAYTPVVIAGSEGSYTLTIDYNNSAEPIERGLTGVLLPTEINSNDYILANGEKGIGFYITSGGTLAQNKAYIKSTPVMQGVRGFGFVTGDDDDTTTGINNTVAETENEEYYDLQGRRVMNPTKGIYVTKSGKKVLFTK